MSERIFGNINHDLALSIWVSIIAGIISPGILNVLIQQINDQKTQIHKTPATESARIIESVLTTPKNALRRVHLRETTPTIITKYGNVGDKPVASS